MEAIILLKDLKNVSQKPVEDDENDHCTDTSATTTSNFFSTYGSDDSPNKILHDLIVCTFKAN
jgi:hypothetical protein